jgi:ribosomal protein S18 acetylase RimI-like enzyme
MDITTLRALLETDRPWAAYALGDLAPEMFPHCEWRVAPDPARALLLLYRAFDTPVLFALGEAEPVRRLLAEIRHEPRLYLSLRPEILPLVKADYVVRDEMLMWRMLLDPTRAALAADAGTRRLGPDDVPALQALYADGAAEGTAPDFFYPEMVTRGVFYGFHESGALVAAAGTHLVAASESVAAVGNVYTRRDCRGRGFAGRVTGAVTAELKRLGIRTIALNVAQHNTAAIRVYERLGFARYCPFYEGLAERA